MVSEASIGEGGGGDGKKEKVGGKSEKRKKCGKREEGRGKETRKKVKENTGSKNSLYLFYPFLHQLAF